MNDIIGVGWLVILLLANAFFVAAEFAVISARRSQIEPKAEQGHRRARTALSAMEHATLMLAMSQLGITVCSLLILNVSEPALHHLMTGPLGWSGLSKPVVDGIAFAIALVVVSFLHVVIGEMVPKNLSFSTPDRAVLILAPPLVFLARMFRPLIAALNATANGVLRLCGVNPKREASSTYTLEEVQTIVDHSRREGLLHDASGTLAAAFEFTAQQVAAVALPVPALVTLPLGATVRDVEHAVGRSGFSRYVLLGPDNEIEGYVHLKDVIDLDDDELDDPIPSKRVRRITSIYDGTDLEDALATMRKTGTHLARAFNAAGETTGVLFLEDILEVLVGKIDEATAHGG